MSPRLASTIQIPDVYNAAHFDFSGTKEFDKKTGYRTVSILTVPLKNHEGRVIGVLQLLNAMDPETGVIKPFNEYHKLVVESLTSQAAVVLNTQMLLLEQQNYVKLEQDLKVGRQIQLGFLPSVLPQLPGYETAGLLDPAREVSGDFYDIFTLADEDRLAFIIGDVCDKGVGAALFMALFRSLLHSFAEQYYQEQFLTLLEIGSVVPGELRTTRLEPLCRSYRTEQRHHADKYIYCQPPYGCEHVRDRFLWGSRCPVEQALLHQRRARTTDGNRKKWGAEGFACANGTGVGSFCGCKIRDQFSLHPTRRHGIWIHGWRP